MANKTIRNEVRIRFPRIVVNLITALVFFIIGQVAPYFVSGIEIPGMNIEYLQDAGSVVRIISNVIVLIFIARAAADAIFFADVWTEITAKKLGIREERPIKRIARDIVYIILTILLVTAAMPVISPIPEIGGYLTMGLSLLVLGLFIVFTYDMGRTLYLVLQERTVRIAEWLGNLAGERNRGQSDDKVLKGETSNDS